MGLAAGDDPLSSEEMIEAAKRDLARPSSRPEASDRPGPSPRPPPPRPRRRVRRSTPRQPVEAQRALVAVVAALVVLGLGLFFAIAALSGGG